MVFRRLAVMASLVGCVGLAAPAAQAQDHRIEVGVDLGYTTSDGVSFEGVRGGDGFIYNGVGPKDSSSWGLNLGYHVNDNAEVGFLFSKQGSTLEIDGTNTREIGDMSVDNYHGYFAYNFGDTDAKVRPYVLLGLGATHYGSVPFTVGSTSRETEGNYQFSSTWGAGVKIYPTQRVGLKLGARWTPTYIKSDSTGWWCDPYWGCFVTQDAQFSNQFSFTGGVTIRF
jgi:opacity protein-like surface antigen